MLAEKAANEFAEANGLSVVTLLPVVAVGAAPATELHTSVPEVLSLLSGNTPRSHPTFYNIWPESENEPSADILTRMGN